MRLTGKEFEHLWRLHRLHLERRARLLLPSPMEAEEAMGELLLAALRARERLPAEGENGFQFRAWIHYMLRMEARTNYVRKQRGQITTIPLYYEDAAGQREEHHALNRRSREQYAEEAAAIESHLLADSILQVASALKNKHAAYILLNRARGCTLEEMAQTLSLSREGVRGIAARAERLIRKRMQEQGIADIGPS